MLDHVQEKAEGLRQEPYVLFRNDCITKSLRLIKMCKEQGIPGAKFVWCALGKTSIKLPLLGRVPFIEVIHAWVDFQGNRIEVSRPIGNEGILGIIPSQIKPVITVTFHFLSSG